MEFASRNGTFTLELEGRSGTPILPLTNLINGNIVEVTVNFNASNGAAKGFYYTIMPTSDDYATAVSPATGVVQSITGWASCTRIAYFKISDIPAHDPTEEVDFEVEFSANDLGGDGQRLNGFVISARVVDTINP